MSKAVALTVIVSLLAIGAFHYITADKESLSKDNSDLKTLFESWKVEYEKDYQSIEENESRFKVFLHNLERAEEMNQRNPKANFGLTQFSDLTEEEFGSIYCGYKGQQEEEVQNREYTILDEVNVPSSVNWTAKGIVTHVKNQGECGSCWAFSTTGSTEALHAQKTGNLVTFSEQQLMDCSWTYGNKGCLGGLMDDAFKYIMAKGIETEKDYPYKMRFDIYCKYDKSKVAFNITGYTDVPPGSISQLQAAVAQQPVSIAVQANQAAWQFYKGGIVEKDCGQQLDHGVLAAGYGTDNGVNFWYVKNSWGAKWGENGYIRIESSTENLCGVLNKPSYPTQK